MKYTILVIILIYANIGIAQMKLDIIPSDSKYAKMQIECNDQAECDDKLLKWIDKQKFFKGEWSLDPIGSIASKIEIDLENNETTSYFHPNNFSVNLVDMSAEIAEKALEKSISEKVDCGDRAIKFIAKNNVKKNLSNAQIKQMVQTYSDIFDLLKAGAIDTALIDVQNTTVDGTILTSEDKTAIINFLTDC